MTEADFQSSVVELATICGWQHCHVRRTIGKGRKWVTGTSVSGWPDLTLWRPGRFLMVELKTDTGRVTTQQDIVLESLRAAGVDVRVWRPRMWDDDIQPTLTAHRRGDAIVT